VALQDKTEAPTSRRREEARDEGRVAKSNDITSALVLLVSLFIVKSAGNFMFDGFATVTRETLTNLRGFEVTTEKLPSLFAWYGAKFGVLCLPIMVGTAVVGLAANVLQVGFKVTPKAIKPDFKRMDPFKGAVRLVSPRSAMELLKSIAKVVVVAYFVYALLKNEYPSFIDLATQGTDQIWAGMSLLCWRLMVRGAVAMLVIGVLDFVYQRYSFEQSLKMTKQEVKEEHKRSEGDPQVKGMIRQRQREMGRRRSIQDVARADVVIANPTHIAVAIRYDPEQMAAPTVVAKGQRLLAEKIKAVAAANGVPIVENKPVARLLYKTVEIGQGIPEDLYQTVAEILAYVYQLGEKAGRRRVA
jgi:flagellar biosynthetic protein FlhB